MLRQLPEQADQPCAGAARQQLCCTHWMFVVVIIHRIIFLDLEPLAARRSRRAGFWHVHRWRRPMTARRRGAGLHRRGAVHLRIVEARRRRWAPEVEVVELRVISWVGGRHLTVRRHPPEVEIGVLFVGCGVGRIHGGDLGTDDGGRTSPTRGKREISWCSRSSKKVLKERNRKTAQDLAAARDTPGAGYRGADK